MNVDPISSTEDVAKDTADHFSADALVRTSIAEVVAKTVFATNTVLVTIFVYRYITFTVFGVET